MTLGLSTWKLLVIILYFPTLNLLISSLFGRDSFELALALSGEILRSLLELSNLQLSS